MTKLSLFACLLFLITSCTSIYNYQVYKTESSNLKLNKDLLVFEDSVCKVSYNLWSENGNATFLFYNKTDQIITIDLTECFFVMNGISYDYFQDRTYTYSAGSSNTLNSGIGSINSTEESTSAKSSITSPTFLGNISTTSKGKVSTHTYSTARLSGASTTNSRGYSISYSEQNTIKIPGKTSKIISEFSVVSSRFKHCDLLKNPSGKSKIDSLKFTSETSPFVFLNNISYHIDTITNSKKIVQNNFYVSTILNMGEDQFYYMDYEEGCGRRASIKSQFFKYNSPRNFYLSYPIN
jgi:hypothetical protein